jgi:hypothetical protein
MGYTVLQTVTGTGLVVHVAGAIAFVTIGCER